jgi:hypothetical protein
LYGHGSGGHEWRYSVNRNGNNAEWDLSLNQDRDNEYDEIPDSTLEDF